jgi:hypothetical protein
MDGIETTQWLLASNFTHITIKMYYSQSTHTIAITGATAYQGGAAAEPSTLQLLSIDDE